MFSIHLSGCLKLRRFRMIRTFSMMAAGVILVAARGAVAQSAAEVRGAAPVVPLSTQPPAKLIVDSPLAEPLSRGLVVIQYRTENLHIAPVFGPAALAVSPRIGHLHVTVDDLPWHWVDASGEPLTLKGMPAGEHKILIELANPNHAILDSKTVTFVVPKVDTPGRPY
jgi:hypothetical protein